MEPVSTPRLDASSSAFGAARWVLERPVQALLRAGNKWALLIRGVAYGDQVVPGVVHETLVHLGRMTTDIDAALRHDTNRQGVDTPLLRPGALYFEALAGQGAKKALGHLARRRVVRT